MPAIHFSFGDMRNHVALRCGFE